MRFTRWLAAAMTAAVLSGCAREITRPIVPNQPPTVRLVVEADATPDSEIHYAMSWTAQDPDGRVDRYLVAVDPRSLAPAGWMATRAERHLARLARPAPAAATTGVVFGAGEYHVFAVRAIDEDGAISEPATRAFFGDNAAPEVTILDPTPSPSRQRVPPTFQVRWAGEDTDGRVVEYRHRLFGTHNPDFPEIEDFVAFVIEHPDSLARLYGPDFAGWTAVDGGSIQTTFEDLESSQEFVFAITAIDEDGAFDPVFSTRRNLLHFRVGTFEVGAPTITLNGMSFTPGYKPDPSQWIDYEIRGDVLNVLNVSVQSAPGVMVKILRWRLELPDGAKEGEEDPPRASIELGPFRSDGEISWLHLECRTRFLTYQQTVRVIAVQPQMGSDLLIVNDTRFPPDQFVGGQLQAPRGRWPSVAELDTFLFAVGGFPWRGYPPAPGGGVELSRPGIFQGYAFDTVGTRGLATGTMPLALLSRYRHVIWCTDALGANFVGFPQDPTNPTTMLRYMNAPGRVNTLADYVAMGGRLWVMGGGAAFAALVEWNAAGTPIDEFSAADGELVPGRFMVDWARWRSRIATLGLGEGAALHLEGVVTPFVNPATAPGRGWPGQPDYSGLPASLELRTKASDPLPPRVSPSNFYLNDFNAETLTEPNAILEDQASTLDTLYFVSRAGQPLRPAMTLHHGADGNPALFSGFALWDIQRAQAIPVVDFVLQELWGLPRADAPRTPVTRSIANRTPRRK